MPDRATGFVLIHRSIFDNTTFRNAGEAMFFAFLVLKANWRAGERRYDERVYRLNRGELVIGARRLAEEFGWSHKRARTLIKRLINGNMIGQNWTQHGAQRAPVTTICNYDKFQTPAVERAQGGAQEGHKGGTPKKEGKESNNTETSKYAFSGTVIRLTHKDFTTWAEAYSRLDLRAELQALDDWYAGNLSEKERKNCFYRCSQALAKKNRQALAVQTQAEGPVDLDTIS